MGKSLILHIERNGTPGTIRTCDLRIRSPLLYPAELRAHNDQILRIFMPFSHVLAIRNLQRTTKTESQIYSQNGKFWQDNFEYKNERCPSPTKERRQKSATE